MNSCETDVCMYMIMENKKIFITLTSKHTRAHSHTHRVAHTHKFVNAYKYLHADHDLIGISWVRFGCLKLQQNILFQLLQMTKKMLKTLDNTRFAHCPVVAVAAKPGGPEV